MYTASLEFLYISNLLSCASPHSGPGLRSGWATFTIDVLLDTGIFTLHSKSNLKMFISEHSRLRNIVVPNMMTHWVWSAICRYQISLFFPQLREKSFLTGETVEARVCVILSAILPQDAEAEDESQHSRKHIYWQTPKGHKMCVLDVVLLESLKWAHSSAVL